MSALGRQRVGVFGGAFDPPHLAHRALAMAALAQLELDHLRVVPTGQAWHKERALTQTEHRLAMVELNFGDLPRVVVDRRELDRAGPSYTVDTLREIHAESPMADLFLLMGEDQARALTTWREWREVARLAIICVAARVDLSGIDTAFKPPSGFEARFQALQMSPIALSATQIRGCVATHQGIAPLVFEPVARYIDHHHLYQDA
jgi:nicotinate-nucleotide adenylyltransferase